MTLTQETTAPATANAPAPGGVVGLLDAGHVKPGATVIDVGIDRTPDGVTGDVRTAGREA